MQTTNRLLLLSTVIGVGVAVGCGAGLPDDAIAELPEALEGSELALFEHKSDDGPADHRLLAWAALPQSARTPGPTSGQFASAANGVTPPFVNTQPIPGFSGLLPNLNGTYTALPDNGFGSKGNSSDYLLGYYNVKPSFKTRADGTTAPGPVVSRSFTAFNDRNGLLKNGVGVELTITADRANYFKGDGAGIDSGIPVDSTIRAGRLLTGYDFDVESIARAKDGTYWIGEEFGPYILHFAANGTLLQEPLPHPYLKSPQNPDVLAGKTTSTLAASRGFESLAFDQRARLLYAVPEGAPTVDTLRAVPGDERVVEIFEVDPRKAAYTGRSFKYRKDGSQTGNAIVIGDMANIHDDVYVLIERDSLYGADAVVKRLYLIDLDVTDADGVLEKRLLIDLLNIDDPRDISGPLPGLAEGKFNMPFDSIESVHKLDPFTLVVAIDTNFPGEDGRVDGTPDSTEIIKLRFARPLFTYAPSFRD